MQAGIVQKYFWEKFDLVSEQTVYSGCSLQHDGFCHVQSFIPSGVSWLAQGFSDPS